MNRNYVIAAIGAISFFIGSLYFQVFSEYTEYLKILLSWPSIGLLITLILVNNFKQPLSDWLSRLKIEYGGAILSGQQIATSPKGDADLPQIQETPKTVSPITEGLNEGQLKDLVLQWRANAYIWEYRYLNTYLVYNTQRVLDWLYDCNKSINLQLADTFWIQQIPRPEERIAIVDALSQHHLIQITNSQMEITEKGREYVEFRGKVPSLAALQKSEKNIEKPEHSE